MGSNEDPLRSATAWHGDRLHRIREIASAGLSDIHFSGDLRRYLQAHGQDEGRDPCRGHWRVIERRCRAGGDPRRRRCRKTLFGRWARWPSPVCT